MNHDRLTRRLTDHLHDAASAVPLRPGSELAVVRLARRRSTRRRQLTAAASVVAVGGVTTLGLHQLSGDSGAEIRIGSDATGTDGDAPVAAAPDVPATVAPVVGTVPAAELVDSSLVWRTVRPDSAEAVGMTPWGGEVEFPGVLLSTAPGRSEDHVPQLWRSDDGITFTQTGTMPSELRWASLVGRGDRLYSFATAPGVAAEAPNPLLATFSADGGTTWDELELPVDTHDQPSAPGIIDHGMSVRGASIADDGSMLVLVGRHFDIDMAAYGVEVVFEQTRDGLVVPTDDCDMSTATTAPSPDQLEADEALEAVDDGGLSCESTLRTWEEIGVPAESAALLREPRYRLLHSADGTDFADIELPEPDAMGVTMPGTGSHVVVSFDHDTLGMYRLTSELTWQHMESPPGWPSALTEIDDRLVLVTGGPDDHAVVSILGDDGMWRSVDLSDGTSVHRWLQHVVATPSGMVAVGYSMVPVSSDEPTDGLVTTMTTTPSDDETGATTMVEYQLDDGGQPAWELFHSADGVRWSKESIADLAGVPAEQISSVARVATAGDTFVVTVTLIAPDSETIPEQVVLVGTPAG